MMDKHTNANLSLWNDLATIHWESAFYDVASFRAGKTSLKPVEIEELDDVSGHSLLHLQCHFGLDTLSWARLGAKVTGVDFSGKSIALAQSLSQDLGLEARFICSDIYQLPTVLSEQFDIVFTSYGVLCWLSDLQHWARIVAHFLKPGGIFYIVDYHPVSTLLHFAENGRDLLHHYPFSQLEEPQQLEWQGTYADNSVEYQGVAYLWEHGLSDIINAVITAKLHLEYLHEFPYCLNSNESRIAGKEKYKTQYAGEGKHTPALLFSLKATKRKEE